MEYKTEGTVFRNVKNSYDHLSAAEKRIADTILEYPEKAVNCNVSELANASGTSDATIIRFCKHLGYSGYYQLRITLSRELGRIDRQSEKESEAGTIAATLQKYATNIQAVAQKIDEKIFQDCARLLSTCNYVHIVAAGNTTTLAHHLGFRLGRLGIRSTFHALSEYFMNDVFLAEEKDVIVAITQSGTSKQVVKALELAVERKIPTIAVVGYEYSPASRLADYLLPAVVPGQGFDYRKNYAHIYEMAILDALMEMIANNQKEEKQIEDEEMQEILLADMKL